LLPLAALGGVFGGIGYIALGKMRPPASIARSRKIQPLVQRADSDINFKILSGNTELMLEFLEAIKGCRPSGERASEIGNKFLKMSEEELPDIVCLQEVFDLDAIETVSGKLLQKYLYVVHSIAPREFGSNSGLLVATKYPIEEIEFFKFDHLEAEDAMANKGILRMKVKIDENRSAVVYNAHLQSSRGDPPNPNATDPEKDPGHYDNVTQRRQRLKTSQLNDILERVKKDDRGQPPETEIFVCGDLNVTNFTDTWKDRSRKEAEFYGERDRNHEFFDCFEDAYEINHQDNGKPIEGIKADENERMGSTYDKSNPSWGSKKDKQVEFPSCRLDYILRYKRQREDYQDPVREAYTSIRGLFDQIGKTTPSSDHLPLISRCRWKGHVE